MSTFLLEFIPENLYFVILSEWIDTKGLVAYDTALCNRSLRTHYVKVVNSQINNINSVVSVSSAQYALRLVEWRKKKNLNTSELRVSFIAPHNKLGDDQLNFLFDNYKQLVDLRLIAELYCFENSSSNISDALFLPAYPKLHRLSVTCARIHLPEFGSHAIYPFLTDLELNVRSIDSDSSWILQLTSSSPFITRLKLQKCGLNDSLVLHLLRHYAPQLNEFAYDADMRNWGDGDEDDVVEEEINALSIENELEAFPCLHTLSLQLNNWYLSNDPPPVFQYFIDCFHSAEFRVPVLQSVTLSVHGELQDHENRSWQPPFVMPEMEECPTITWVTAITSCATIAHLQVSFDIDQDCPTVQYRRRFNDTIVNTIAQSILIPSSSSPVGVQSNPTVMVYFPQLCVLHMEHLLLDDTIAAFLATYVPHLQDLCVALDQSITVQGLESMFGVTSTIPNSLQHLSFPDKKVSRLSFRHCEDQRMIQRYFVYAITTCALQTVGKKGKGSVGKMILHVLFQQSLSLLPYIRSRTSLQEIACDVVDYAGSEKKEEEEERMDWVEEIRALRGERMAAAAAATTDSSSVPTQDVASCHYPVLHTFHWHGSTFQPMVYTSVLHSLPALMTFSLSLSYSDDSFCGSYKYQLAVTCAQAMDEWIHHQPIHTLPCAKQLRCITIPDFAITSETTCARLLLAFPNLRTLLIECTNEDYQDEALLQQEKVRQEKIQEWVTQWQREYHWRVDIQYCNTIKYQEE